MRPAAGALTTHALGGRPAHPPAALKTQTDDDDANRRQTTDTSKQYNTIQLRWPVK